MKNNSAAQETRRRLLLAAGQAFADRGFHGATIKEITDSAGASLASVNYHFKDKAELYAAVLKRIADDIATVIPSDAQLTGDAATRLKQFIRLFCTAMIGRERPVWQQVLMAREHAEPTAALDPMFQQVMYPLSGTVSKLVAELLELPASDPMVGLSSASVLGQCVYYIKHEKTIGQIHPQLGGALDMEQIADHIAAFSLAAIRAQRRRGAIDTRRSGRRLART